MNQHEKIDALEHITENLPDGITERYRMIVGDPKRRQEVNAFAPSQAPHEEYPADLPFIPFTVAYVTTCPDGELPPGARWQTNDPADVAEFLIAQSRADGWYDAPQSDDRVRSITAMNSRGVDMKTTCLMRNGVVRAIVEARIAGESMVQLLDTPPAG